MGRLLRALKLEDPLPQELAGPAKQIGDIEKKLTSSRAKPLKLKESALKVAENLNDLEGKVEPALLAAKKSQLESLAQRIADRGPNDRGLTTDAMELQVLLAESECVLKDSKSNREGLQKARTKYGEALVARLDTGGDLAKDLKTYIDGQLANENTTRVTAALKAIDELRNSTDPRVQKASVDVANMLARETLAKQKAAGPSKAKRDTSRTPNDVLVHLMTVVNNSLELHKDDPTLKALATDGRKMFMTHTLDTAQVNALVVRAEKAFATLKDDGMVGLCGKLKGQLPESDDKLQPTQLQDNIYGRVFDTKMVSGLVKKPPKELLESSGKSGSAFADMLADSPENEEAAKYFVEHYVEEDKRPWSAAVPAFGTMAGAKDGKEALAALKLFLKTPPTTGQEIIAFSYVMAKMPQAQKQTGHEPPWLLNASGNYSRITGQANRERGAGQGKVMSKGAGITMLHQPDASDDDNLVESERPGTANRMGIRGKLTDGQELSDVKRSKQNDIQLNKALPFASGVSGTTNILLHLYEEMEKNKSGSGGTGVEPNEFLMNSMMFLVYDGGHSMHEAMWTANQIQADLKTIDFGLNDPSQTKNEPNQFVSDYDRFMGKFKGPLKTSMDEAQDTAWQGTQEYLEKNSAFA
ncbi:MAG TPA: hypothetical protein VGY55_06820 [Pirellulales bacterium]|nr:hypothetical protein [Pirellulales bacterium]